MPSKNLNKSRAEILARDELLKNCNLCPRRCGVDRLGGDAGFCRAGRRAKVFSYMSHFGEEPPISGTAGSGTIFFSHCTMRCVYCQNYKFSQLGEGREVTTSELAEMMRALEGKGCHNINLVTPTHFLPQILAALEEADVKIPIVYNTSGYESVEMLKLLEGVVDIYLPDMRYGTNEAALRFSGVSDYVENNRASIKEMYRQVGNLVMDKNGVAKKGLVIRHLVLPEGHAGTSGVFEFLAKEISADVHISLMSQYFPAHKAKDYPAISRRITKEEYNKATETLEESGLKNGWIQTEWSDATLNQYAGINFGGFENG